MKKLFIIDLSILMALGFVPNQKKRHHTASVTIGGHTVWAKNFHDAMRIANRVTEALYRREIAAQYRVEDMYGNRVGNW